MLYPYRRRALTNTPLPIEQRFARTLTKALKTYYRGRLPSFSVIARDFALRSPHLKHLSGETVRNWVRGTSLPHFSRMQVLEEWLGIHCNSTDQSSSVNAHQLYNGYQETNWHQVANANPTEKGYQAAEENRVANGQQVANEQQLTNGHRVALHSVDNPASSATDHAAGPIPVDLLSQLALNHNSLNNSSADLIELVKVLHSLSPEQQGHVIIAMASIIKVSDLLKLPLG